MKRINIAILLFISLFLVSCTETETLETPQQQIETVSLTQTDQGHIIEWAMLGPFEFKGSTDSQIIANLLDSLSLNENKSPVVGSRFQGKNWNFVKGDSNGRMDMIGAYGILPNVEVYAACILKPQTAGKAIMHFGSDDGIQVWLDGNEVHRNIVPRGLQVDQDKVTVDLPDRPVLCVLRITQIGGDWSFSTRVTDTNNQPLAVSPSCQIDRSVKGIMDLNWNKGSFELKARISNLGQMESATVKVIPETESPQDMDVQLGSSTRLAEATFQFPWITSKNKPETVTVQLWEGIEKVAEGKIILPPNFIIKPEWVKSAQPDDDPWLLKKTLARDDLLADAFLGNGYYGIRVGPEGTGTGYGESMTRISGIYKEGARVKHPRWTVVDLIAGGNRYRAVNDNVNYRQILNMKNCVLTTQDIWDTGTGHVEITMDLFPHRASKHLLVMQYTLKADRDLILTIEDTLDMMGVQDHSNVTVFENDHIGLTYQIEAIDLQEAVASKWLSSAEGRIEHIESDEGIKKLITLPLKKNQSVKLTRYATIHTNRDSNDPVAACIDELDQAEKTGYSKVFNKHKSQWHDLWESDILVENTRLQQMIHSALFQSYCHLRNDYPWSVGPVGLSNTQWQGRVFWDADLWVFPPLAMLQPNVGRAIVEYRYNTLEGAKHDAKLEGRGGAKFAWESAQTGIERCPWPPAIEQRHLQNDVAFAQWLYYLCSGDEEYLKEKGSYVIEASANFWVDRVTFNEKENRYEILHVLGADEYAENINNNTLTNYGAIFTLKLAAKLNERFNRPVRPEWNKIADMMYLPFDEEKQIYMQHDKYDGEQIKQADTSIAIYPYEMPMSDEVKRNILNFYPSNRPATPIMMSSAIYSIAFAEINDMDKSMDYFNELIGYFWQPYLLASESPNHGQAAATNHCMSFITGIGGFLQTFLNGFAGIRVHEDGLMIEPSLPDDMQWMEIKGLHYRGHKLNLRIEGEAVTIKADSDFDASIYNRKGESYEIK